MIDRAFAIYPSGSVRAPFILRRMKDGKLAVRDEYEALVCKKCRKVNELAALAQGIQKEVVVRSKRPFLGSADDFNLLDERAKQAFATLFPNEIEFFPIPTGPYCVASAKVCLQPEESNPGFRFAVPRCVECGRPGEVVWGKEPLTVAERKPFMAANVEGRIGARVTWIVSDEAAEVLRRITPPLTGMVLSPKQVNIIDAV
jgi:hypothetical protein